MLFEENDKTSENLKSGCSERLNGINLIKKTECQMANF